MAASRSVLKRLSSSLISGSPRPVTLSAASRSGSHRPGTLPAASHSYCTNAENSYFERVYVDCDPKPPNRPHFIYHESKLDKRRDGLHVWLYMAGVGKESVKVWIESGELVAQGIKDKGFEDEDDTSIVMTSYKMLVPPGEIYNLDEVKAEINNGMLKVVVPRRNPEQYTGYRLMRFIFESHTTVFC